MRVARAGRWSCLAGAALGALGLAGWITHTPLLTTIVPGQPPMMPNTALALSLIGVAGALRHRTDAGRAQRALSLAASLVVLAIGLGTLVEYAADVTWPLDQLLFRTETGPFPGRPSPPTALALTLLATALLLFDYRAAARTRPSEWLVLLAGLTAFAALMGHLSSADPLYRIERGSVVGVAIHTAVGLLLTSVGLLLERPDAGVMRIATSSGPGGVLLRRLALPVVVASALLGLIVTWSFRSLGVQDFALVTATLVTVATLVALALLVGTAVPLDRAHDALESSRIRMHDLVQNAPDAIFVADLAGRYTEVNAAGVRLVGYTREEILGKSILDLIPPEDVERLARSREQILAGSTLVEEWTLLRRDGTPVPVEINAKMLPDRRWQAVARDITERKRLEKELRLAEAKASGIVSLSADAIVSIDEDQRITLFNEGAEKIFGHTASEVAGAPLDILLPERFRARHREHVKRFAMGDVVSRRMGDHGAAVIGLRKNGEEFPADAAISKLTVDGQRVLTVALRDTTEQRRAEQAVQQSRERIELALAGADLGTWDWNVQTGEVIFNARWAEMRGYRLDEVRPHVDSWISGIHPDDRARVERAVNAYFEGSAPAYETEHRVRTKSGDWMWVLDRGKVFARDAQGRPTRMAGTELDVTVRMRLEAEHKFLAEASTVLASTLELDDTLNGIARHLVRELADFCVVDLFEADTARLTVASRDPEKAAAVELLARAPIDRARPHLCSSAVAARAPVLLQRPSSEVIASLAQSDDHLRALRAMEIESVITVPLVARETLVGAMAIVSGTRSRAYGAAEVSLMEQFAARAALSIENARLYGVARRAIRARDDVLGVVAHDLRSPLGNILMQAALLGHQGEKQDGGSRRAAELIERSATRMSRLIQDLLDVSRMEAGRLSVERGRVPGAELAATCVEAQKALASSRSIELRADVPHDLPDVWGDRDRLQQVFENLIGNAIKFTERGGRVVVHGERRDGEALFSVTDTGLGIGEDQLPHVFDRFWKARAAGRQGAGLGLAICKGIVEAHGGRIWVESAPGHGSTFYFTVPIAARAEDWRAEPPRGP